MFKFVTVFWNDTTSDSKWTETDNLPKASAIATSGWLIRQDKHSVTTAASLICGTNVVGDVTTIPRGCITRIRVEKMKALK